jgi:hypothetical protein
MSTYKSHNLSWRGNDLRCAGKTVVGIAPDRTYTGMWRVVLPDGRLSDMANRARAKDAAMTIALGLNSDREETASGDPSARFVRKPLGGRVSKSRFENIDRNDSGRRTR